MKKAYSKPEVVFESFSLNVSIATCENEPVFSDSVEGGCKGYFDSAFGAVIFVDANSGCVFHDGDKEFGTGDNTICYHVPINSANLFGS